MKNRALGRGLSSLLREEVVPIQIKGGENNVDIELIEVNEEQPRKHFNQERIKELADSIISHGLLQPIIVIKLSNGKYQIVAGERRFRASKLIGLKQVPIIIKELNKKEILEIALIENIQRQELSAIEEAEGFQELINVYGYSQGEISAVVGKSKSHISNLLRINSLPDSIKMMVNEGRLSMGHARCLIGLENAEELSAKVIANDLNVRQTEELANNRKKQNKNNELTVKTSNLDDDLLIFTQSLSEKFGVKVTIEENFGTGKISFHYRNMEELDTILSKIN